MADLDPEVRAWWLFLCAVAAFNVFLWLVLSRTVAPGRQAHRWLSLVYVVVCGFRGVMPRADVQRIVLFDTWVSSIAVGRSVATVAELACVVQWSLLAQEYGRAARVPGVVTIGRLIVPLICFAEVCSWYSVLTTNYLGNTLEESSWTLMAALLASAMLLLRKNAPHLKAHLAAGIVGCGLYVAFMVFVDVAMYLNRWLADTAAGRTYFTLPQGWSDITHRWVVTGSWAEWRPEIAWMTLYFSAAVWVMTSLMRAPEGRTPGRAAGP